MYFVYVDGIRYDYIDDIKITIDRKFHYAHPYFITLESKKELLAIPCSYSPDCIKSGNVFYITT